MGEKNRDTRLKDRVSDSEEFDELDELELKDKKNHDKEETRRRDEKRDRDLDRKKSSSDDKDEKKTSKKDRDELLDDEEESFGTKVVIAVVVIAIIAILLLKACSGKTEEYDVTFNANGGTLVSTLTVKADGTITKPADPTKSGYVFAGWYYNDELFDFNTKITGDIKLEARWTEAGDTNVSGVSLDRSSLSLLPGSTATLVATVAPASATNKSLTWSSSNTGVATVNANGIVTAVKDGTATITVTTVDGSYKATCTVTVSKTNVAVTGISLNKTSLNLAVNESSTVTATVTPSGATNKKVSWTSNNTKVATVNASGKITGVSDGTAVITATTDDGKFTATLTVTVKTVAVTSVSLNKSTVNLVEGKTETLKATIKPTNASVKDVTWSSSDASVATVDKNGKVTAKKAGTAIITVTTKDGAKTATATVKVTEKTYSYTYKATPIADEAGFVNYYKLCVLQDKVDISSTVTAVFVPAKITVREGSCFRIATIQFNNLATTITADYKGNTINVKKG
jgi:Listeria/Bacterioides repeat